MRSEEKKKCKERGRLLVCYAVWDAGKVALVFGGAELGDGSGSFSGPRCPQALMQVKSTTTQPNRQRVFLTRRVSMFASRLISDL
jgi:hypothetical protein